MGRAETSIELQEEKMLKAQSLKQWRMDKI